MQSLHDANDVHDEQHVLFECTHAHVVSFCMTYASLFPDAGFDNVSAFLCQNKLSFLLRALTAFFELASSRISWLKAFSC